MIQRHPRTRSTGRPTLDQVAVRAGVGRGTASRVVNGSAQVSAAARAAVQRAIEELGYVPNRAARALVTQRTEAVALVIAESPERGVSPRVVAGIIRGVSAVLLGGEWHARLVVARSPDEYERVAAMLAPQHVDGALVVPATGSGAEAVVRVARGRNVPVVLAGRPASWEGASGAAGARTGDPGLSYVDSDGAAAARIAVACLVRGGRRRIAAIVDPTDQAGTADVAHGWREAVAGLGFAPDDSYVCPAADGGAAVAATRALLARHSDVDGVVVGSDVLAAGVVWALRESGRAVPGDVAVVGYEAMAGPGREAGGGPGDRPGGGSGWYAGLAIVERPGEAIGRCMARMLVARLRGSGGAAEALVLAPRLVVPGWTVPGPAVCGPAGPSS
jgi:DNA-binding LacI/PurR family transcriptional regulator